MIESDVASLLARFEVWLRGTAPHVASNLRPPAEDGALAAAATGLGWPLPAELDQLLRIHNGGNDVIGGWDLLSAEAIVERYLSLRKYADESAEWIPFVSIVSGDYLCVDLTPGPAGTVGQVFRWNHDDDADPPMAPSLTAWLERIVACVEAGEIIYHRGREEFLPFYGSTGLARAFETDPAPRFDAARSEVQLGGPRKVAVRAIESAESLPEGCRVELVQAGKVVQSWDVDALRETEECATEFNVLVEDPTPWVALGPGAVLRVRGLAPGDLLWVHLAGESGSDQDDAAVERSPVGA